MHVTSIDRYDIEPGTLTEWTLLPTAKTIKSDIPPSYNQRFHLDTARAHGFGRSVWMAGSLDLPGTLDRSAVRRTFEIFIRRHDALWTGFDVRPTRIERLIVPPDAVALRESDPVHFDDPVSLRAHLCTKFTVECDPLTFPAFLFATVERPTSSTVIAAFDHTIVDGLSLVIALRELRQIYELITSTPAKDDAQIGRALGDPGSFMAYCEAEAGDPPAEDGDPRIRAWSRFYEHCGGTAPRFPLDLGVEPGRPARQASDVRRLLDGPGAALLEEQCLRAGGTMFTGVLSAIGTALRREGGPLHLPLQFPLHTRHDHRWKDSIGWLTATAPIVVPVAAHGSFESTLTGTHASFRSALTLKGLSMEQVRRGVGEGYRRSRTDLFMVSYIDYRKVTCPDELRAMNAHHISNVTVCDDAQFWVSRTEDGVSLRSRYPDTATAHSAIARFLDQLASVFTEVIRNDIMTPAPAYS
ncbi:condensation domain-containing protein [Rhodococcus tibetensis]|uniref:Condensation domain-containing protein n=1 Tax=Rhodococcus tibetensis TaxID=2965064 RepID=A0ABT1Q786_9NOCA|nr:condensation domain-containing protein [Rhodococcus sp. FXJ9.536]MCQ4118118.1 condensation domain-containing protein [Rhodococcus sp. FXJ9.536]